MKIGTVKTLFYACEWIYIRAFCISCQILVTFCLSVLHIMVLEVFYEFHENQCSEVHTFFCGHNWNYIYMCAVKWYYMLAVKNTLVKSFILCRRVHHLQCCVLTEKYHRDVVARLELNPLPVQFTALLHGQKGCVFFSGHLNLRTTPETGLPCRGKKIITIELKKTKW